MVLLPLSAAMIVFSAASALIFRVRGPRTALVLGGVLLMLGNVGFALLPGSVLLLVGTVTVGAIGAALAYSALPLIIMGAVPNTETAAANSLNTLMRQLGTSTFMAVVAAVGAAFAIRLDGQVFPSAVAYVVAFTAAAVAALVAVVIALLIPVARHTPAVELTGTQVKTT